MNRSSGRLNAAAGDLGGEADKSKKSRRKSRKVWNDDETAENGGG
jgi:hypothetical protein